MSAHHRRLALILTISLGGFAGFAGWRGGESDIRPEQPGPSRVAGVEGTLLVDEVPAGNASIAFHPIGEGASRYCPVAITRADGSFRLTTFEPGDGAPPGEYRVTVIWHDDTVPVDECECPDPRLHDRLKGLFADRVTSPLRATVRPRVNAITLRAKDAGGLAGNWSSGGVPAQTSP